MGFEIIGIDHVYVAVSDMARSEKWYDVVMPLLGFKRNSFENEGDRHVQYFNRHFGFVLRPAHKKAAHDPLSPGLHHFCLRVENKEDIYGIASTLGKAGIDCSTPGHYPEYAPDYYAVFFSDPDGIRLEVTNYRAERRHRFEHWDEV
ncbi:MAG TPA: VOC family protein [Candidatus Saccharimonadales bacterium]|nr:VOC family protein [Candidatus Saccharimonadales bacterium]